MADPGIVAQGRYVLARRHGSLVFTAGITPRRNGQLVATGKMSAREPLDRWRDVVELACANALTVARQALGEGESIACVLSCTVYLAAEDGFVAHSQVADFASDYLFRDLGAAGIGARAAVGVATLPGGAPVEIQLVCAAVKDECE